MSYQISNHVLLAYEHLGKIKKITPIEMGLINKTFLIETNKQKFILQEIAKIFSANVHEDFFHVALFLKQKNILCPQIVSTIDGKLFFIHEGKTFRAQTYIEGKSYHQTSGPAMAFEAGKIVGSFHEALKDFSYEYKNRRNHGADYDFHMQNLQHALKNHVAHDYFLRAQTLSNWILENFQNLLKNIRIHKNHVHGDLKISNIIFDDHNKALSLVDFDTLSDFGWAKEMGDALRSWCNKNQEDVLRATFDLALCEAALKGYALHMGNEFYDQKEELLPNLKAVTLCLSTRYLTDTLNESYFSFDEKRFTRRAEHNFLRANSMFQLFENIKENEHAILKIINEIFKKK